METTLVQHSLSMISSHTLASNGIPTAEDLLPWVGSGETFLACIALRITNSSPTSEVTKV